MRSISISLNLVNLIRSDENESKQDKKSRWSFNSHLDMNKSSNKLKVSMTESTYMEGGT